MIYDPSNKSGVPRPQVSRYMLMSMFVVALVFTLLLMPSASASAQSFEFDFTAIDLQPFFDGLQTWLPVFIAIFGFIGAIVGSMALARTLINAVIGAFRGESI